MTRPSLAKTEATTGGVLFRKFHRKAPVLESLFNKVAGLRACNFVKKRLQLRFFPVNFVEFLRTPFSTEHHWWLLLKLRHSENCKSAKNQKPNHDIINFCYGTSAKFL